MSFKFLPYQRQWIEDSSQIKIMEKSRQVGISFATAYSVVRNKAHNAAKKDAWVSSRDEPQARLFIEDCKKFAEILHIAASDIGHSIIDESTRPNMFSLKFASGSRIHSLSSNPDAQAGKRGARVLDEFALHQDPRKLYAITYPGITWGGSLEIISTHRGKDNFFNQLIQEARYGGNPKNISLHRVTLQDALDQGFLSCLKNALPKDDFRQAFSDQEYFDSIRKSCPDEESFQQEYMCNPMDTSSNFFSEELISSCEYPESHDWQLNFQNSGNNPLFLGVDIGRDKDLTVFWLVEKIQDTLFTRSVITLQAMPFHQQEKILHDFLKLHNLHSCFIDQTGIGRQFVESAQSKYGANKIIGISFTQAIKETLAFSAKTLFENQRIRIPSDTFIRSDFRSIKKNISSSGNLKFDAAHTKNGHGDRFWAMTLAVHAAKSHSPIIHFESFERLSTSTARN